MRHFTAWVFSAFFAGLVAGAGVVWITLAPLIEMRRPARTILAQPGYPADRDAPPGSRNSPAPATPTPYVAPKQPWDFIRQKTQVEQRLPVPGPGQRSSHPSRPLPQHAGDPVPTVAPFTLPCRHPSIGIVHLAGGDAYQCVKGDFFWIDGEKLWPGGNINHRSKWAK